MTEVPETDPFYLHDTRVPRFIYGTAWKEQATSELTLKALNNGFTAIDTANQRKHYFEEGVGEALQNFYQTSGKTRDDLFLQTKFTYLEGQDNRLPYSPGAETKTQVEQSFLSSLEHLKTDYLDAYLLHGPSQIHGLSDRDFAVWEAMENFYRSGQVKLLGVSNVNHDQLEYLSHHAAIKPMLVQNRCFASTGWDATIRELCHRHNIHYQGFSLLTANSPLFEKPEFQAIMARTGLTGPQVIFQAALKMGMIVLTGTSDAQHMQQDLNCLQTPLTDDEVALIEQLMA
ncbi:aldo/keto reductase [Endozoicomonas sp. SCSIO W0465]|uniref:aldo/keto reductase family protein n=1 Tax=Endozoicomonas sp. SCSIO W0465 TaxID=2918516 RepID=UPI002074CE1F|nr:aldo/keto reductase [Endozoicomonas sp. SCSIO W0465]USE34778.1 aldo/keto reductase [Endozoicomonas sp. SCSIO W0465]